MFFIIDIVVGWVEECNEEEFEAFCHRLISDLEPVYVGF